MRRSGLNAALLSLSTAFAIQSEGINQQEKQVPVVLYMPSCVAPDDFQSVLDVSGHDILSIASNYIGPGEYSKTVQDNPRLIDTVDAQVISGDPKDKTGWLWKTQDAEPGLVQNEKDYKLSAESGSHFLRGFCFTPYLPLRNITTFSLLQKFQPVALSDAESEAVLKTCGADFGISCQHANVVMTELGKEGYALKLIAETADKSGDGLEKVHVLVHPQNQDAVVLFSDQSGAVWKNNVKSFESHLPEYVPLL